MTTNSETAILDRVIRPDEDDLSPDAAGSLLRLGFRDVDLDRMDVLAAKARAGRLTPDERDELTNYEHVSHLIALMQSKARRSLLRGTTTS